MGVVVVVANPIDRARHQRHYVFQLSFRLCARTCMRVYATERRHSPTGLPSNSHNFTSTEAVRMTKNYSSHSGGC